MAYNAIEVGMRIANLRKLMGCNQEQYSEKLNISKSTLSKIEVGIRNASTELLVEIAEFSGVTLDYLILGKEDQGWNKKLGLQSVIAFLTELEQEM